jgi:hypothetical protein
MRVDPYSAALSEDRSGCEERELPQLVGEPVPSSDERAGERGGSDHEQAGVSGQGRLPR